MWGAPDILITYSGRLLGMHLDGGIGWFRYVRHCDVGVYEGLGWVYAADLGLVHGYWCVLMRWAGDGEP